METPSGPAPSTSSSAARIDAARRALGATLGADQVLSDPLALRLYSRDASMVEGGCALVAFPRSIDDLVACVTVASEHGLPIVPRGSGTGLAGGATPIGDALVVVTSKMTRLLEVRTEDRLAWVEPGMPNLDLANALAPHGFTFAPDPSSQQTSSIGGNVNTNAGGPHCLAYGVTSAHVLALDVVLPDGSLARLGSEAPEWAGYDLRGIVVGSEGTLGIVARVCVRLTPVAPAVRTMLLDFTTVQDCAATVSDIIAGGVVPAAVEMMDHGIVVAAERFAHAGYPTDAAAILIVEVDGTKAAVQEQSRAVESAARANAVREVRVAADAAERALLWKGRKSAFGAVAQIAPHYHLHDCVVPRTKLVEVLAGVYEIVERHELIVTNVFHAGDGNLHPLISFDRRVPGTLERVLRASDEIVRLCVAAGGTLSGEHGIGLEKRDFMPLVFTAEDLAAQDCVRSAFDPQRRMNPQKVLPSGARCGDYAMLGGGDAAIAAASLPEGSWI
ncbi:MAG: FAD-linked oxidase C-terminal domain-containing protein [Actinomycetota bacterium]